MADELATRSDLDSLELRLLGQMAAQEARIEAQELRLLERIERPETRLLSEFRKWVVPFTARTRVFEATGLGLTGRTSMLDERVDGREQK